MRKLFMTALVLTAAGMMLFSAGAKEGEEVVIDWPCIWVGADSKADIVRALIDEYNEANAGSIRVEIEEMPDYAVYDRKIVADIAGGNVPDLFTLKWNADTRALYNSDIIMDFTDDLASGWAENFQQDALRLATVDGRTKTLPYETAITPIWHNTKLFEEAGITEFPATIDEMWTAFDKLKAIGVVPASQMTGANNAFTTQMWYSHIMNSLGGPDVWELPLTDPLFVQGAEILKRLFMDGNTTSDAIGAGPAVSSGHYMAERTAIFINGPWFVGNIRTNAPDVYALTELTPAPAAGPYEGSQVGFLLTTFAAANTKNETERAAVIDFLHFLSEPEVAKRISIESGSLLTPKYAITSEDEIDPLQAKFIEQINSATFIGGRFDTFYPISVLDEFGPGVDELVAGRITAEKFTQILENARY
jgi:raffinose/stachyose/melibiose transport system substrate-binding protein